MGEPHCPDHDEPLAAQTISQMVDQILTMPNDTRVLLLAPMIRGRKGEHLHIFEQLRAQGFVRGRMVELDEVPPLEKNRKHNIEAVVDRFKAEEDIGLRLPEPLETALNL